jgi:hypothetical protein
MKNIEDYDEHVWERLFEFVFPDEKKLSRKEVQSELQKRGVDIRPAWDKIQMALNYSKETERARKKLESAKKRRPSIVAKLKSIQAPYLPDFREQIKQLLKERFTGPQKAAYFRKLESASDEDLKTLLEDFSFLEEFSKDSNNVEP